ncbi:MAG: hypothetical protein V1779_03115 [bacterium]
MRVTDRNSLLMENYLGLIDTLSHEIKIDLISYLTKAVKNQEKDKNERFRKAFNSWKSDETADELNEFLMKSRNINRKLEKL